MSQDLATTLARPTRLALLIEPPAADDFVSSSEVSLLSHEQRVGFWLKSEAALAVLAPASESPAGLQLPELQRRRAGQVLSYQMSVLAWRLGPVTDWRQKFARFAADYFPATKNAKADN